MIDFVPYSFCNAIMVGRDDDLPFRVELWDDKDSHIEEVLALASDYATARSAFDDAVSADLES